MDAPTIVIKFGGTSLGTPGRLRQAANRVRAHLRRGQRVIVVTSAVGHTTDRILSWIQRLEVPPPMARREIDRALATGESLAAALLAARLRALELPAVSLTGAEAGIAAEGPFGAGALMRVDPWPLRSLLDDEVVPVVAGFQARRADGETVTLGRGASDLTAVAIAAELEASACHLVTDVAAVFDRDPNAHSSARPLLELSHRELLHLAEEGAQVVHPGAARLALAHRVPLCVYSYRAPFGEHH